MITALIGDFLLCRSTYQHYRHDHYIRRYIIIIIIICFYRNSRRLLRPSFVYFLDKTRSFHPFRKKCLNLTLLSVLDVIDFASIPHGYLQDFFLFLYFMHSRVLERFRTKIIISKEFLIL